MIGSTLRNDLRENHAIKARRNEVRRRNKTTRERIRREARDSIEGLRDSWEKFEEVLKGLRGVGERREVEEDDIGLIKEVGSRKGFPS